MLITGTATSTIVAARVGEKELSVDYRSSCLTFIIHERVYVRTIPDATGAGP